MAVPAEVRFAGTIWDMSETGKWFDRKFAFAFGVELYPNVCVRLRGAPARLEGLEPEMFGRTIVHSRLKQPMRLVDHLYFVAEHDDQYLMKIWEEKRKQRGKKVMR